MTSKVFESEACRVWTGALGAPLHVIEDAEQHKLDVVPFNLQIWLNNQRNVASVNAQSTTQQGIHLIKSPNVDGNETSSQQVVVDVDDTRQQGYFFGRVRRAVIQAEVDVKNDCQGTSAFYDTEVAEELLVALHTAFPKVNVSSSAKESLTKREMNRRTTGTKLGEMVKRRKTLSAEAFYGSRVVKPTLATSTNGRVSNSSWGSFYEKLQFRVSHSLMCQLEGTAPISSSFPRQQEAFEFADQVAMLRKRVKATREVIRNIARENEDLPRFVHEFISDLVTSQQDDCEQMEGHEKLYTPFLVNTETEHDSISKKQLFIDTGVYTRNRMFRVLGSSKFKKQAVLRPLHAPNSALTELDQKLFLNTLVCPYPSLEDMELTKRCRFLRCEPSSTVLSRTRRFTTRQPSSKSLTSSSVECRKSIYPALDAFIRSQATTGGVQGEIRAIQMLMTSNSPAKLANLPGQSPDQDQFESTNLANTYPWMIIYHMARNRWCANIRRPHKSNNVMFIVDIDQRVFYQKCHDPTCQAVDFRYDVYFA
ncbi:unnamed protein product [Phytophthora lilii]|uniref:DNA-directed primase/polymerase protein n=1 Tax=Phytophthora lilii TaxID=2077276 RepID=A0A9W6TPB0_9STRA|nr:unnamed protein product [Phytophthora lilii]